MWLVSEFVLSADLATGQSRGFIMASPQLENGYAKVSNELLEALSIMQMSGTEWQYVMCLIRKSYGFNQKEAWIKNVYVSTVTGLPRQRIYEAKLRLLAKNIVTQNRDKISLNKDYDTWSLSRKNVTLVTEKRSEKERKSVPIKETKKRNKIKEIMAFKKYNEDRHFEEEAIDMETGLPTSTPKGKKKERAVDADVLAVFELFNNPASALWRMREIERVAAQVLFESYGLEKLKIRLGRIEEEKKKKDPYFPEVNTPSQLLDKMSSVERYFGI